MKILIATDMEGITGVVNWDQVDPQHAEYGRFRKLMTGDVNAAIQGVFEGGASEVVVADGHAYGYNLLLEELDSRAVLNSGNEAPFAMMQGIGEDITGVILIGYHARVGTQNAILDHTWSSRRVANLWINETLIGEIGLSAGVCGYFNVPLIMISGDQSACQEATELLGPIETAVIKHATGRMSAECLPPEASHKMIKEAAERAVRNLSEGRTPEPYRARAPIKVTIQFAHSDMADRAIQLPGAERLNGRQITFSSANMLAAFNAFQAAVSLARE
jgi:D-amino peptidase